MAKRLLARGVPAPVVARQLGASKSWIQRVQQEIAANTAKDADAAAS
ncbi:MAG: hypothetical protein ACR2JC_05675 [Chloroflexota bacterium]